MTCFAIFSKGTIFIPVVTTDGYNYYYHIRFHAELATLDYNNFVNHIYYYIKHGNQSPSLPYLRKSISTLFKSKTNSINCQKLPKLTRA